MTVGRPRRATGVARPRSVLDGELRAWLRAAGVEPVAVTTLDRMARWYRRREAWKGTTLAPTGADPLRWLRAEHPGKLRRWFPTATWVRGYLRSAEALAGLVALDSPWVRAERLVESAVTRTLGAVVEAAERVAYFDRVHPGRERHHWYRALFQGGALRPVGDHALLLRTLEADEEHPPGSRLYLHDGIGRALPYLWLARRRLLRFQPVEVWVAVEAR